MGVLKAPMEAGQCTVDPKVPKAVLNIERLSVA
jgi:hypothetical protein